LRDKIHTFDQCFRLFALSFPLYMRNKRMFFLALGLAIGMSIGVAFNSIAMGAGIGVALGVAMFGVYASRQQKK
jgi:hypothetical protein